VTPLIITRFDETEIASWYLFASLNLFGVIVAQRMGLTFSRMFSFAMGGASHLGPIREKLDQSKHEGPNWNSFEKAYGTIGAINIAIGVIGFIAALAMGWFGLSNLLIGYEGRSTVWIAFFIMQGAWLTTVIFQHYQIALQGMNYIALVNRWGVIFGVFSCLSGSLCLLFNGGLIAVVIVMQFFVTLEIVAARFLLRGVEGGRVLVFKSFRFDREAFGWAWAPTWKGFLAQFGFMGGLQVIAILFTAVTTKSEAASYFFALRMMQTVGRFAQAPFTCVLPLMSRLLTTGHVSELRKLVFVRAGISLALLALGVCFSALAIPVVLSYLKANISFIPIDVWLFFGLLTLLNQFNVFCGSVSAIGNEIIYYWHTAAAAIVSVVMFYYIGDSFGYYGPILSALLPLLFILNVGPFKRARDILEF